MQIRQLLKLVEDCEKKSGELVWIRLYSDGCGKLIRGDNVELCEWDDEDGMEIQLRGFVNG